MTTLTVEQLGEDLVIRLTPEANAALGLRSGDQVQLSVGLYGDVSLTTMDLDHQLRHERGRAFLRRMRPSA
jgi:hypothetical protein